MSRQWADTPEFHHTPDLPLGTGDTPVPLSLLSEQWLRTLFLTAGASLQMQTGKESVTLSVTIPATGMDDARDSQAGDALFGSFDTQQTVRDEPRNSENVWVRLRVPFGLRRRFKATAWRLKARPSDVLRGLIEEFVASGRLPTR
jgi:hypothetical protein